MTVKIPNTFCRFCSILPLMPLIFLLSKWKYRMSSKNILVIGGKGKTGKRVADRLAKLNLHYQIASRSVQPKFDWREPNTWPGVLSDVAKVYITFQPDLAVPDAVNTIKAFVHAAKASGVQKLVLLSGRGEHEARHCEEIVMSSGVDWTIVRASWFCQNFSESFLLESIVEGFVTLPAEGVLEPFVDADDIADVVVASLTSEAHSGKLYELTGRRLLSFEQAIAEISRATNRVIAYRNISIEAFTHMLKQQNVPSDYIWLLNYLFTEVLDGRNANVCNGVEQALGRKPIEFLDYITKTAATPIWPGNY